VLADLKETGPEEEDKKEKSTMELADVYKGKDEEEGLDGDIERVANPMHSAAVAQLRESNAELIEDNAGLRGENARLKERLWQNGTLENGDDIEDKEKTTTMSVPQQGALEADELSVISSTDDATSRLAGFGNISGKKNSLHRKANPHPRPQKSGCS
jgi:hypothetical protein